MNTRKLPLSTATPLRLLAATAAIAMAAFAMQPATAAPHGERGGPGGAFGMMGGPKMVERMLDTVNASADQRAQIKQILEASRTDMRAQHEAGRKLREDTLAIFTQPNVDARAAEALRQQMLAQHDQASKRMLQTMLDVSRVLTPEQRKTLADRMAQRRAMMERHRAEREGADKAPR
jgi:Spy/CpxP family protein refolding chaperone